MMTAAPEAKTRLTRTRVPLVRKVQVPANEGRASVAGGVDALVWAKSKKAMDDTAMTNSERWEEVEPVPDEGDVRMEKVERLRAAIANGTYAVSAEALAEKMIEHMCEADELSKKRDGGSEV